MELDWIRCDNNAWCDFLTVNLDHPHFNNLEGVYIIWHGTTCVRVGQGVIRDRLRNHRANPDILAFQNKGLRVTWAAVPKHSRDGVERFLAEQLRPLVGDRFPDVAPITVNLPR